MELSEEYFSSQKFEELVKYEFSSYVNAFANVLKNEGILFNYIVKYPEDLSFHIKGSSSWFADENLSELIVSTVERCIRVFNKENEFTKGFGLNYLLIVNPDGVKELKCYFC